MPTIQRTVGEISEDTLKLQAFLSVQQPGTLLSYGEIQEQTEVPMDYVGKARLRSALNGLKLEYSVIRGEGIRLADHRTAAQLVGFRFRKIDSAVKRADKTHRRLQEQFIEKMTPVEQRQMLFAGAVFGAIRLAAEQGRQMHRKEQPRSLPSISIPIPQLGQ